MRYSTLDEAWQSEVINLHVNGKIVNPRQLECKELISRSFCVKNPRARFVFRKERRMSPFYAIGELLWYLSGSNKLDFINYYSKFWNSCSDDGETLNSAYGNRIFGYHPRIDFNQFTHVVNLLKNDLYSRQAIIHFKTPSDSKTKDEVCTLSMQFIVRNKALHAITTMRSNDLLWGTTYDVYFFTILQELIALHLKIDVGSYYHNVGSLHLYKKDYSLAEKVLDNVEDTSKVDQEKISYEFTHNLKRLLEVEHFYRTGSEITPEFNIDSLDNFSQTIVVLLDLYKHYKKKDKKGYQMSRMYHDKYIIKPYKILLEPFDKEMS